MRLAVRLSVLACSTIPLVAQEVVFRSDVSLVRADAQVVDGGNRALSGLRAEDFVLREQGQPQQIRNFASEKMPVDVLLLIDVSGSMRVHVQRLADAAADAVRVLGPQDRTALVVFDRSTRVRMPFRLGSQNLVRELDLLLNQETFNGGTDITRALLEAARYVRANSRAEARRAIVILTDDQTERERDEAAVARALTTADAVLCALLTPAFHQQRGGGSRPSPQTWPGSGGGLGGPLGGIILGRRGGYGGRQPGGVQIGGGTHPAGTSEIARRSGGDSMSIDDGSAFADTLSRIRNRYALHFLLPAAARAGEERQVEVDLSPAARRRYPDAEVRYRRAYFVPDGIASAPEPAVVSQSAPPPPQPEADPETPRLRRRPAVDPVPARDGPAVSTAPPAPADANDASTAPNRGSWRKESDPAPAEDSTAPNRGSWRRLKPGEQP